jgi:uncharacterized pyridoxamine 5'-phosphate oxidase family protein
MAKKRKIALKDIFKKLKKMQVVYLATVDGKKPRVRPVSMIHCDRKLWITTYSGDAKVRQIRRNPNVEFCLLLKKGRHNGTIRGGCRAHIIKSKAIKRNMAKAIPFFKLYWKSADEPSFCLLRLHPREFEYMAPGQMYAQRLKAQ